MRAQIAFEYIVIVGMVLLFLVPLWAYIRSVQETTSSELTISYAQNAVQKTASQADLVWSQGPPAKITSSVYIPAGVTESEISGSTIRLRVQVGQDVNDIAAVSNANITGTLPASEGTYQISLTATATGVALTVL